MKRKIAILLATTMTLTAVPTFAAKTKAPSLEGSVSTVSAGAKISTLNSAYTSLDLSGSVNNKETALAYQKALKSREAVLKVGIDKLSTNEITKGSKFTIQLENGKFDVMGKDPAKYAYRNVVSDGTTAKVFYVQDGKLFEGATDISEDVTDFDSLVKRVARNAFYTKNAKGEYDTLNAGINEGNVGDLVAPLPHIPYSIEIKDETTAEVTFLTDINDIDITKESHKMPSYYSFKKADNGAKDNIDYQGKVDAYFAIPLGEVESTGGEELKAKVVGFSSTITDGTVTVAKTVGSGSTAVDSSYISKKTFETDFKPSDLIIRENTKASFENGKTVTVRVSNGFEFKNSNLTVVDASNGTDLLESGSVESDSSNTKITFRLNAVDNSKQEVLKISLPEIRPVNGDKNYGEVSLTISGAGISSETVVVGERQKLGFKLETKTDVPTITKGRYVGVNTTVDSKESTTADFEFSEAVPESLLSSRNLDFTVPAGVKIADATIVSSSNMTLNKDSNGSLSIVNDGTTLRLERNSYNATNRNSVARLRLRLKLSVDAGFKGEEIKVAVTGGGTSETLEAVVAKVQDPFTITATPKNINIGYQDYSVSDIVITENKPGMFMEGGDLELNIRAPYGTEQIAFTNAKVAVSGGNLELVAKNNYVSGNTISMKIKSQSTKEPSTITISDVKVGTSRSIPFGAYNLEIKGSAVINNDLLGNNDAFLVDKSVANGLNFELKDPKIDVDRAKRIDAENGSYKVDGYINVVTATDTIDKEMKVTIGSTTTIIDGKEVTMDVAPYIQANGNTMVPVRFVAVALAGGDASSVEAAQNSDRISWDPRSKTITIYYGAGLNRKIIQFQVGSSIMTVDSVRIPMENGATAEIKDGRTFVPFRSLGQALGINVSWDAASKTAIFNQK